MLHNTKSYGISMTCDHILGGNHQLYNVLITTHAFSMIFFTDCPCDRSQVQFHGKRRHFKQKN
jgi:hypothetical protein